MTVLGGLQWLPPSRGASAPRVSIPMTVLGGLQYKEPPAMHCTRHRVSIPMTVLGGLQFHRHRGLAYARVTVSIPMTVLGGLQYAIDSAVSLGTSVSIPMTVLGGLQCKDKTTAAKLDVSFNTDDGIRRAAIACEAAHACTMPWVSIPMTVLGGLQCQHCFFPGGRWHVSIPMTVLGGLQSFGPWVDFIELCRFQYR